MCLTEFFQRCSLLRLCCSVGPVLNILNYLKCIYPGGVTQLQGTHTTKVVLTFCAILKGLQMIFILPHFKKNNIFFAVYPTSAVMNVKVESDPSVCVSFSCLLLL